MVDCTVHLFSLKPDTSPAKVVSQLKAAGNQKVIIAGIPHGWVHKPRKHDIDQLLGHQWHLFVLTSTSQKPAQLGPGVETHIALQVAVPEEHWNQLLQPTSTKPSSTTPKLPTEWNDKPTGNLKIPSQRVTDQTESNPAAGVLKLDPPMADFLSTALPQEVNQQPVSLFNLFKYRDGDSAVHDQYMEDFKSSFGDSAGASVKFMGRVGSGLGDVGGRRKQDESGVWQEANLTHYDSIYHYAYMLSTDVYQELNKEKVRGLEDTCILLVSEMEMSLRE
jgi:hypothetical protein